MMLYNTYFIPYFISFLLLFSFLPIQSYAQLENDECTGAIELTDIASFCSAEAAFSNEEASTSPLMGAGGLSENGKDVWFQFTAIASHITITVRGRGQGGTIREPEVQLLATNQCEEFLILDEETDNLSHIAELNKGGLVPGTTYLIRIQGQEGRTGNFQLCIDNFFPPQDAGSDLNVASVLCDKSSFTVQQIGGAGLDDDEADGTCLDIDDPITEIFGQGMSEQSSTWFKWVAANDGTLAFTLTPIKPDDDLDFVLYELPNGLNNGDNRVVLRCMAASCIGPTGLNSSSQDVQEDFNCDPGEDNFVKAVELEEGHAYALLINNFSESGNGFVVDFGGTVEFEGPSAAITGMQNGVPFETARICIGETVSFDGTTSSFSSGSIVEYKWIFGVGATPDTAIGAIPEMVSYDSPGEKTIALTVTTSTGCKVTEVREAMIMVDTCCLALTLEANATEITEGESSLLTTTVTNATGDLQYTWSAAADLLSCTDCPNPMITPIETTTVGVTVTDANGCEASDSVTIDVAIQLLEISIPNAFTPDFDGTNDRFTILGGGPEDRIISLLIYSRWGELVYEANDIPLGESDQGWDGDYKGERQQPDIYIYHAVVLTEGEERAYTGDLMLIR